MIDDEKTCKRIKEIAINSGYAQMKQLADALYVTPQAVFKWYRRNKLPSVENLVNMADLFGCKVDDLIVRKGE